VARPDPRTAILAAARERTEVRLPGLGGSSPAWLLSSLLRELGQPVLWVAPDDSAARRAQAELRFFLAQGSDGEDPPEVHLYPEWDSPPYKGYSPSAAVTRARLASLARLGRRAPGVVVASAAASLKRVVTPDDLHAATETLAVGSEVDRDAFVRRLVERGYLATDLCSESGTFAVRGHILDIWGPSQTSPARVEFWGDEIESIRSFDPWTQRSRTTHLEIQVLPAREEILAEELLTGLPGELKALADARGLQPRVRIELQRELVDGRVLQQVELFLPLMRPRLATVFDHLAPRGLVVVEGPDSIDAALVGTGQTLHGRWLADGGHDRLVPEPSALFLDEETFLEAADGRARVVLPDLDDSRDEERFDVPDLGDLRTLVLAAKDTPGGMLEPVVKRVRAWQRDGVEVALVGSRRQLDQLAGLLDGYDLTLPEAVGDLNRGFCWPAQGTAWIAADLILGARTRRRNKANRTVGHEAIGSLHQLGKGDLIVHALHGIGRYEGLDKLRLSASAAEIASIQRERAADPTYVPGSAGTASAGSSNNDYLLLVYRDGDRLYLPVHKLNLLARYVSAGGPKPRLDKLGGQTWAKRRKKVAEEVQKIASELLALYARRSVARSHAFAPPDEDEMYRAFVDGFPFEETLDQQAAIDAVLRDMGRPTPMDRLVVGDVGFGKTEVALRASFLAVLEGRQAAILVPTTILALQHFQAFRERLAAFPISVEMLSRFRTAAQQRETREKLKAGTLDIVVGTHALLSRQVEFAQLGLLVVDEEHRFGVKHKERIKEMRAGVDVLTLTATPIPRTLHMALSGIRDFSIIDTAPEGRRAVRTSVARFSTRKIADAIRFELERGGQIFFVHNRVKTIGKMASWLRKMVPEANIRVAHGQMETRVLESLMLDFFQRKFDVLVATTIVESGIDVPTANTIIVHRADRLGLAQMHQLRGRVGRSHAQAFCLLLVPPGRALRRVALERLKVIQDHSDLGSGHRIAQHDMELRGAGNLLGKKQSGHIADVGLVTYMELLESAVRKLKGDTSVVGQEPEVDLRAEAWIPADYIPDERDRLGEYKRLADCKTMDELGELFEELTDRYGRPPEQVLAFERLIEVKVRCRELKIISMRTVRGGRLQMTFDPATPIDPGLLMKRVAKHRRRMTFRPEGVLLVSLDDEQKRVPVDAARAELTALAECVALPPATVDS
jgi:transcription-repair coupling factor (superfamily II helicase)